jgi:hypothetical protein
MTEARRSQNRTMLLLIALFFVPLVASMWLYFGSGWRPQGSSAHGMLFDPVVVLPLAAEPLHGKWSLLYVGEGACDENCRRSLVFARQTRLSLNQEMDRVQRVLLATGSCCDVKYLDTEHQGIKVFDVSGTEAREELLGLLPPEGREHSLYVVDPLGNVVMRYDTRESPRGLLTDMKKLLKLSNIG